MKKSWADHSSSDDESVGEDRRHRKSEFKDNGDRNLVPVSQEEMPREENVNNKNDDDDEEDVIPLPLPLADFSSNYPQFHEVLSTLKGPPFSAHIGNLSYRIQTDDQFCQTIEALVTYRYQGQERVHVSHGRLVLDRETKKSRGFGIVSFDTLDELVIFLNLSDGHCFIEGRDIKINISTPSTSKKPFQKYADIDGSKFRGGKYTRNTSTEGTNFAPVNSTSGATEASKIPLSPESDVNLVRNTSTASAASSSAADKQRPTLKLMPRSKPIERADSTDIKTSADIFGGAKPRIESQLTSMNKVSTSSGIDQGKLVTVVESSSTVIANKVDNEDKPDTTKDDVNLKTDPASSKPSTFENQRRDKKHGIHRGPRNADHDRSSVPANGRPHRTNINSEDRIKRDVYHEGSKDIKKEKHENKAKDSSNQPTKEKAKANVDGWEYTVATQKEKRASPPSNLPVLNTLPQEQPAPSKKKPTNAYEALYDSDSD